MKKFLMICCGLISVVSLIAQDTIKKTPHWWQAPRKKADDLSQKGWEYIKRGGRWVKKNPKKAAAIGVGTASVLGLGYTSWPKKSLKDSEKTNDISHDDSGEKESEIEDPPTSQDEKTIDVLSRDEIIGAIQKGRFDIIWQALESGQIKPNKWTYDENTSLYAFLTIDGETPEIFKLFLDYGVDPMQRFTTGVGEMSLLDWAIKKGQGEIVGQILATNLPLYSKDEPGQNNPNYLSGNWRERHPLASFLGDSTGAFSLDPQYLKDYISKFDPEKIKDIAAYIIENIGHKGEKARKKKLLSNAGIMLPN